MRQYATFNLDQSLFGMDILQVKEINQVLDITPVPLAPPFVRGLINLRGQIVTILDLGARVGLSPRNIGPDSHNVILKTNAELAAIRTLVDAGHLQTSPDMIGLLVDGIGDVVEGQESQMAPPPANMGELEGRFVEGVLKLENELMVLLNTQELLRVDA